MTKPRRGPLFGLLVLVILLSGTSHTAIAQDDKAGQTTSNKDDIYLKLFAGKYSELEGLFTKHLEAYASGKISEAELASKFEPFAHTFTLDSFLDKWIGTYPKSYAARLARARYRIALAWVKRGSKFASETSDNQFREFVDTMKNAESDLKASIDLYARPVESFRHLITVSMALGKGSARGFLDAALKLDSAAYHPREAYLYSLTPKWGGSVRQMEAFFDECKQSQLSGKDKARIAGQYYSYLGEQARLGRQYETASENYLKAYESFDDPAWLYQSGKAALDAGQKKLAFDRFNRLAEAHPKYVFVFTERGYLYETDLKDDAKAFKDYLKAAELGSSWAQNRVGSWYMNGRHVARNLDSAELYFRRAAAQNDQYAIANLRILDQLRKAEEH